MDDNKQVKIIMPLIRKVMPTIIANDIVGVQPMTGSSGDVFKVGRISRWKRFWWRLRDLYWRWLPGTVITIRTSNRPFPGSEIREWLETNVGTRYWSWNWQATLRGVEIKFAPGKGKWATMMAMRWS